MTIFVFAKSIALVMKWCMCPTDVCDVQYLKHLCSGWTKREGQYDIFMLCHQLASAFTVNLKRLYTTKLIYYFVHLKKYVKYL